MTSSGRVDAIEIILSAKVQKRWRVTPAEQASDPPTHWLGQWRVDFGQKPDRTSVALVANTATLYTFVFPLKDLGKGGNFEMEFRRRLRIAIPAVPGLTHWTEAPLAFVTGNPRKVVGSMNNMIQHLAWRTATRFGPVEADERLLNDTPFSWVPEGFPRVAFAKRLAEAPART